MYCNVMQQSSVLTSKVGLTVHVACHGVAPQEVCEVSSKHALGGNGFFLRGRMFEVEQTKDLILAQADRARLRSFGEELIK